MIEWFVGTVGSPTDVATLVYLVATVRPLKASVILLAEDTDGVDAETVRSKLAWGIGG